MTPLSVISYPLTVRSTSTKSTVPPPIPSHLPTTTVIIAAAAAAAE